ncbi:MAG TPA: class I SAM-dependent methyltransferase [Gemmatimonadales bacterium]|nr:class I SAM-dependent methyltransferase [Gemmatimonadales bacterium]
MTKRMLVADPIERYVERFGSRETPPRQRLRAETAKLPQAGMQIGADQGAFMALLIRLIGARRALEVGTFTGYSAMAVAEALPPEGRLVTCDISEEWTAIARRYWREAELDDKIELRLGDARATLAALRRETGDGSFDFAFIDADKSGYDHYYEACLQVVRPGGLILIDNVLWSGKVADPAVRDRDTVAIRELNAKIAADPRVEACLLTVGDGVMAVRKK